MNKMKFMVLFMSITMIFSGCASMNNTGKGAAIGAAIGTAVVQEQVLSLVKKWIRPQQKQNKLKAHK